MIEGFRSHCFFATIFIQSHSINSLQDLHESTEKLLQLRITKQALARERSNKHVAELLDGSVTETLGYL
jgi:hypothetical protein